MPINIYHTCLVQVPDPSFDIPDVRSLVGGKRIIEVSTFPFKTNFLILGTEICTKLQVMNSATQLNSEMTLRDWEEFFMHPDRDDTKLNCISLEFSNTRMEERVIAPRVVRQIDWVDHVWPR